MPGEQPLLAQSTHGLRMTAGQRAALGLHVAEAQLGRALRKGPRDGRQLAVQREHGDGALDRQRKLAVLDGRDGVLQARVVELDHVGARETLAV